MKREQAAFGAIHLVYPNTGSVSPAHLITRSSSQSLTCTFTITVLPFMFWTVFPSHVGTIFVLGKEGAACSQKFQLVWLLSSGEHFNEFLPSVLTAGEDSLIEPEPFK